MFFFKKKMAIAGLRQYIPGEKRCKFCGATEEDIIDSSGNHHFLEVAFKDFNSNNQAPSNLYWKCLSCSSSGIGMPR